MPCDPQRGNDFMKFKNTHGYSMIEIGIGLLIIMIFSIFSLGLFNGCYNNHHVIQTRNLALKYATQTMENILQSDLSSLGFTSSMTSRSNILSACSAASALDRAEGNYAVPEDETIDVNKNITITTKYRRIPTTSGSEAYDNTVIKVSVIANYKIKTNDTEARTLELESIKVTR